MCCDEQGFCFVPLEAVLLHEPWLTELMGCRARVHMALMCILSGTPSIPVSIIVFGCSIWSVEYVCSLPQRLQQG